MIKTSLPKEALAIQSSEKIIDVSKRSSLKIIESPQTIIRVELRTSPKYRIKSGYKSGYKKEACKEVSPSPKNGQKTG